MSFHGEKRQAVRSVRSRDVDVLGLPVVIVRGASVGGHSAWWMNKKRTDGNMKCDTRHFFSVVTFRFVFACIELRPFSVFLKQTLASPHINEDFGSITLNNDVVPQRDVLAFVKIHPSEGGLF